MKNLLSPMIKYRISLGIFIIGLILSGITAFPLLHELRLLCQLFGIDGITDPQRFDGIRHWILVVKLGLEEIYSKYPWYAYGTDWLAFGHLVISLFFIVPWFKPIGNEWVLWTGIIACLGVIPLALICGEIRGIPFDWRLIDCSFGLFGILPLIYCLVQIKKYEQSADFADQKP